MAAYIKEVAVLLLEFSDRDAASIRRGVSELRTLIRAVPREARTVIIPSVGVVLELDVLRSMTDAVDNAYGDDTRAVETGDEEVSPREAGEILRMSRPSVMRLVEKSILSSRMVGSHHRLSKKEVMAYRDKQDVVRRGSLDAIADISEEFDF